MFCAGCEKKEKEIVSSVRIAAQDLRRMVAQRILSPMPSLYHQVFSIHLILYQVSTSQASRCNMTIHGLH